MTNIFKPKYIPSKKGLYYRAKLNTRESSKIIRRKIFIWIVLMPVQIWRIPYSICLMIKNLIVLAATEIYPSECGVVLAIILILPAVSSMLLSYKISVPILVLIYIVYMIFRCIYEVRNGFRLFYNQKNQYNENYDEYAAKFEEEYDFEEEYEEASREYSYYKQKADSQRANDNFRQEQNGNNMSNSNMFVGMTPDAAKDKYRDLMKKYHPDNKKTGDEEKAKEIIRQYEEYEQM